MVSDEELLEAYKATGIPLRQLSAKLGLTEGALRYRFRKFRHYRNAVTTVLLLRVTHARGRARKHALAMLRQKRPLLYAELIDRTRPGFCSECTRMVQARATSSWWKWKCSWCSAKGRVPLLL